jgi:hypothetical protein
MKRVLLLVVILSMMVMVSTASAYQNWGHSSQPYERGQDGWQRHQTDDRHGPHGHSETPFGWRQHREDLVRNNHHFEAINDREWDRRFPGLHSYRWYHDYNQGFWYEGYWVSDPVFFFDNDDELASFGFWHNGVFIMFREDGRSYENRDEFFLSWWGRHGRYMHER